MFEPTAAAAALAASGLISTLVGTIGRRASRGGALAFSLAVGLGLYGGLAVLGFRPRWPALEDQDRFLEIVLPAILAAEAGSRTIGRPSRLGFATRLVAAAAVAPLILHGSVYVADLDGPGSAAWPPVRRGLILGGLAWAAACNWSALVWIQGRRPSAAGLVRAQAATLLGAAAAIMLSGYASGGLIAVPLALALLGGAAAPSPGVGVGFVGLFGLLTMGTCFGRLGTAEAGILFVAPLLAGVPDVLPRSRSSPRLHAALGVALTACAAAGVVASAWRTWAGVAAAL